MTDKTTPTTEKAEGKPAEIQQRQCFATGIANRVNYFESLNANAKMNTINSEPSRIPNNNRDNCDSTSSNSYCISSPYSNSDLTIARNSSYSNVAMCCK